MGEFQAIHKYCAVLLALLACHEVLRTHARQIKPRKQHSLLNTDSRGHEDKPQPTLPHPPLKPSINNVPSSAEKKVETPKTQKHEVAGFGDSGAGNTNAFRPTTPGNSPGVGHRKFAGEEDKGMKAKVVVQSPDVRHIVRKEENDFKPTNPGHSPGVGHVYQNKNGELNK